MILLPTPEWMDRAKCRTLNSLQADALFFPESKGPAAEGRRFCDGKEFPGDVPCPVRAECLGMALDNEEMFGVWGGQSPRMRRDARRAVARNRREERKVASGE